VFALTSLEDWSADSHVRAFPATDQVLADKAVRAPLVAATPRQERIGLLVMSANPVTFAARSLRSRIWPWISP